MPEDDFPEEALVPGWVDEISRVNEAMEATNRALAWEFTIPRAASVAATAVRAIPGYLQEVGPDGYFRCGCTECVDRRRRFVNTRVTHRRQAQEAQQRKMRDELLPCSLDECEGSGTRLTMERHRSEWYCAVHLDECQHCGRTRLVEDMRTARRVDGGSPSCCADCVQTCPECEEVRHPGDMRYVVSGPRVCASCVTTCDMCGQNNRPGGGCEYCENNLVGLTGYGKTLPDIWLGGPLPKDKKGIERGYYLGFELEVSARGGNVKVLHEWASEALGYGGAIDCKEDSSVKGFEIATQPMTPQFFESVDWDGMFKVLNDKFPLPERKRTEPTSHGLHVHIGRVAFAGDDIAMAAFCYLIGQSNHLERIARREPTSYCNKVTKPVSSAIRALSNESGKYQRQARKAQQAGVYADRSAINLLNTRTIEIRAFRSTRKAQDLKDAVRLVYVAAEYVRYLRFSNVGVPPRALHWTEFTRWVGANYPDAFESISGMKHKKRVR